MSRNNIFEAQDVDMYKRLLRILGEYEKSTPATSVYRLFKLAAENGKKILPKDKLALKILDDVLCEEHVGRTVQQLLNLRFSNVSMQYRPVTKSGKKYEVAFWTRGDFTSDRIQHLIDWEGTGKVGKWTDMNKESVQLIDMVKKEDK
jgi:hypothetical protein